MVEPRRPLRVAIVALKAFALGAIIFALSAFIAGASQLIKGDKNLPPLMFSLFIAGLAAAAVFYLLSEAGVILLSLQEQSDYVIDQIEQLKAAKNDGRDEEKV